MSKNLKKNVLHKITADSISIKPRWHFVVGTTMSIIGVTLSAALALIGIHLLRFRLTHPGIGAARKLDFILSNLPWYIPIFAIGGLVGGYLLLRRYDFSYRNNFGYIVLATIIGLILGSYTLSSLRVDDFLMRRGFFPQIYQDQLASPKPMGPGQGRMQNRYNHK